MGLKPDHWIRKMAREQGMIEPYADSQVRNGVISYGVSSYGYDIRVADEFKIFTNVYSAVVDPKHFDPQSMVDFKGEVCIIPPNSFALARTIEYFRIPRKVLTVCLGKCLTGDSRVVDVETGDYLPIRDFVMRRAQQTLGLDHWKLTEQQVTRHFNNGRQPVFELVTRLGLRIKATSNHPFRTFQSWTPLAELCPGDRIAIARNCPIFGKEDWPEHEATLLGFMLSDGQCHTTGHSPRFTSDDPVLVAAFTQAAQAFGCLVSPVGRYGYNLVNQYGPGGIMTKNRAYAWLEALGCNVKSGEKFVPPIVFRARKESVTHFLQSLFSGDGSIYTSKRGDAAFLEYSSTSERLILDIHHLLLRFGIFALIRGKTLKSGMKAYRLQITDPLMIQQFAREVGFIPGSKKQLTLEKVIAMPAFLTRQRSNFDTLPSEAWEMMRTAVYSNGNSLRAVGIERTLPRQSLTYPVGRQAAQVLEGTEFAELVDGDIIWDTVTEIRPAGIEEVFDITVPEVSNFLANDFLVHNSTYARCFRGDTRVALVDGSAPTLEEMAQRTQDGELFWGYSIGPYGRVMATLLESPRYIGRDQLLEVTLDNGKSIFCTSDHEFLSRDGRMVEADKLRPGNSLMPLYRQIARGYEMVFQPLDGHLYPTHRLADEWNLRHGIYEDVTNTYRHHKDGDRLNNRPWNIVRMNANEHIRLHNSETYGEEFEPDEHSAAIREAFKRLGQDPDWRERFLQAQRERAIQFWHNETYAEIRADLLRQRQNPSDDTRLAHRVAMLERYSDPSERQRQSELMRAAWAKDDGTRRLKQAEVARNINLRPEITAATVRAALEQTGSIRGASRLLDCDRSVFRRFPDVLDTFRSRHPNGNHKVEAIREVPGDHDVFCLTVPETGNFALESGVFVSNCGIIVNVTPFEPQWEGYVTLEISNTTPLPAKIYANEGIAQVLFFEADEECEVSYADKKGKYQGQQSIVLPKL